MTLIDLKQAVESGVGGCYRCGDVECVLSFCGYHCLCHLVTIQSLI